MVTNTHCYTDLTCTVGTGNSAICASASYNFAATDVGAWPSIASGTNWNPGWYQINSVASNKATVYSAIGQAQSYASGAGQFYLNTVAGVATVATQSSNKAVWSIDRSRSGGPGGGSSAIFAGGTAATTAASTTFTIGTIGSGATGYTPGPQDIGNIIQVLSGSSATASMYAISNASSTTWTIDRNQVASSGNVSWSLGGTFATIGGFGRCTGITSVANSGQRWYLSGSETLINATRTRLADHSRYELRQ